MSVLAVATSALVLGLAGSFHCAGMCGPLVVAGCSQRRGGSGEPDRGAGGAAGYFAGRLLAYSTIGALVGHLGKHAFCILPVQWTHVVAVALTAAPAAVRGISLLRKKPATGLVTLGKKPAPQDGRGTLLATLAKLLPRRGLGLGLATGVLPCGLLLGAFALAAATASPVLGAISMAAFAVGSAPGLVVALFGTRAAERLSIRLSPRVQGALWCALAVWLGVRLALGDAGCHVAMNGV